jgi:hypothetical protein
MLSKGLTQAYEMQDFAYRASMAMRDKLSSDGIIKAPDKDEATIIGTLGKVWRDAQEQVRIHRGKPLPGSLTHEKVGAGKRKRKLGAMSSLLSMPLPETTPSETSASQGQGDASQGDERDDDAPSEQPSANAS